MCFLYGLVENKTTKLETKMLHKKLFHPIVYV